MKKIKIAAVVVIYNPEKQVLENIRTYSDYVDNLIVVDNSDSNSFEQMLRTKIPNVLYINLGGNYGIAKALNVGIYEAKKLESTWVLTMDQDSHFINNIISIYTDYIRRHNTDNVGILCPTYIYDRIKKESSSVKYQDITLTMQSANLLNLDVFLKIGPFMEKLFIDCVDYEYCLRLKKKKIRIVRCFDAKLQHTPATTKEIRILGYSILKYGYAAPIRYYYQARNLTYLLLNYNYITAFVILVTKLLKIILLFDKKKEFLKNFKMGIKDCITNNF